MTRRAWSTGCVAVSLVAVALLVASWSGPTGQAEALFGVSTGVFGEEQALEGEAAFATHCAGCHGAELQGGFGPALVPLDPWQFTDAPLAQLFDFMRTAMPFDDPGSLEDESYLAILAFVLRENGYPLGDEATVLDEDAVRTLVLDEPPAE